MIVTVWFGFVLVPGAAEKSRFLLCRFAGVLECQGEGDTLQRPCRAWLDGQPGAGVPTWDSLVRETLLKRLDLQSAGRSLSFSHRTVGMGEEPWL